MQLIVLHILHSVHGSKNWSPKKSLLPPSSLSRATKIRIPADEAQLLYVRIAESQAPTPHDVARLREAPLRTRTGGRHTQRMFGNHGHQGPKLLMFLPPGESGRGAATLEARIVVCFHLVADVSLQALCDKSIRIYSK